MRAEEANCKLWANGLLTTTSLSKSSSLTQQLKFFSLSKTKILTTTPRRISQKPKDWFLNFTTANGFWSQPNKKKRSSKTSVTSQSLKKNFNLYGLKATYTASICRFSRIVQRCSKCSKETCVRNQEFDSSSRQKVWRQLMPHRVSLSQAKL